MEMHAGPPLPTHIHAVPRPDDINLAKSILSGCVVHGARIIDEAYCQILKQATDSSSARASLRSWQLLYVFSVTVLPSDRTLANAILAYVQRAAHDMRIPRPCRSAAELIHLRLLNTLLYGVRGYLPSMAEVSSALMVPGNATCFSCTLDELMYKQHQLKPCLGLELPEGLHCILATFDSNETGALSTPELFQKEPVAELLAAAIEDFCSGNYGAVGSYSPHVLAGLLKTFLKEMALPVVPSRAYGPLTDAASDAGRIARVLCGLPELNRAVIAGVVRLLAKCSGPQHRDKTLLTPEAAAAVIAPCLMHAPMTTSKEHREAQTRLEETLMKRLIHSFINFLYENDQNAVSVALIHGVSKAEVDGGDAPAATAATTQG